MEHDITFPEIFSVYKTDQIAVKAVIDILHDGVKKGHATDINKVWTQILTLILEDPHHDAITKPAPTSKSLYGFNHIDTSNGDPTKQEVKKWCNIAKINHIHQVTGCYIVYAACQTRYALSSKNTWCEQDGAFNMNMFYVAIMDLFEQYPDNEWAIETLHWWNQQIFGNAKGCTIITAEKQEHVPESSIRKAAAAHAAHACAKALALALKAESSTDDP
ncbi:hypothetical protein ARMGADRAFT_1039719 [Armillaria gallica]|uniref:Uncharacterized protein n=1 Tax=Armillaria gallica TaxID=47427 RepID=A0A2H3CXV6_ARMGA|nr:hypothetical protein ARMGADRAFT_1039719 [Armillaria gallica]